MKQDNVAVIMIIVTNEIRFLDNVCTCRTEFIEIEFVNFIVGRGGSVVGSVACTKRPKGTLGIEQILRS